jgi:hypothetical protein
MENDPLAPLAHLPTAEELRKLPLRAAVLYTARAARRAAATARRAIDPEIIDRAISTAVNSALDPHLDQADAVAAIEATGSVTHATVAAHVPDSQVPINYAAGSVRSAAWAAYCLIHAASYPAQAAQDHACIVQTAELGARGSAEAICDTQGEAAMVAAVQAARKDYDLLLRRFGAHESVEIGDAADAAEALKELGVEKG